MVHVRCISMFPVFKTKLLFNNKENYKNYTGPENGPK